MRESYQRDKLKPRLCAVSLWLSDNNFSLKMTLKNQPIKRFLTELNLCLTKT